MPVFQDALFLFFWSIQTLSPIPLSVSFLDTGFPLPSILSHWLKPLLELRILPTHITLNTAIQLPSSLLLRNLLYWAYTFFKPTPVWIWAHSDLNQLLPIPHQITPSPPLLPFPWSSLTRQNGATQIITDWMLHVAFIWIFPQWVFFYLLFLHLTWDWRQWVLMIALH